MKISLQGIWEADIGDGEKYSMYLPGTLDENRIGHRDTGANTWHPDTSLGNSGSAFHSEQIATRFTRRYTYEGEARLTRRMEPGLWGALAAEIAEGKRIFLEAERARVLRLFVDGKKIPDFVEPSLSTGRVFEVTGLLGEDSQFTLLSDNSYPGLPHDAIVYSSAATDETQTNWNGVLGSLCLRTEKPAFLDQIRVYPAKNTVTVRMKLFADAPYRGTVLLRCDALREEAQLYVDTSEAVTELTVGPLPLREDAAKWDLEEGNLHVLSVSLSGGETRAVRFGIRDFGDDGSGRLTLNGRIIFLRGEANCAVFPETGHPPMTVDEWLDILNRYRSYGVNCMRFHSHCPPEAAFTAADRLGILMQPELSHWNPKNAFEPEESNRYYETELRQVLGMLANHPSFVMLTLGNELCTGQVGHARMDGLLKLARETDPTRLYADASNGHYGENGCNEACDFYTASNFHQWKLRGTFANMEGYINRRYPDARANYDLAMEQLRKEYARPVFGFEVGQFEVLPDFDELEVFQGISDPANLRLIQERVAAGGLTSIWKKYVEATGELSRIGYREEVEAVLRTREMSGISLLGLQDFPGQGTALVGMLNSHLQQKPYEFARPEHFRSFFKDQLPLVLLPRYTWESTERLSARIQVANYGKRAVFGKPSYRLAEQPKDKRGYSWAGYGENVPAAFKGELPYVECPAGKLTEAGSLEIELGALDIRRPTRFNLIVSVGECSNLYPIWVYPPVVPRRPEGVYETAVLDRKAKAVLEAGGRVYLTPPSVAKALPTSIQAQFTTDFWSVGTFAGQEGGMGQLIDEGHPLFDGFPTEFHTNWQWWPMASQRAVILPERYETIVAEMDSYAYLRPMCQLLECCCGGGKLLFSSMGLQDLQRYPEARALLDAIYRYMDSERFAPVQKIDVRVWEELVREA